MLRILILSQSFGDYLGDIKSNIIPTLAAFATQFLSTLIILIIVKKFLVKPALEYMEKRKQYIHGTVLEADEMKQEASKDREAAKQELDQAYAKAREIVEDSKIKALNQKDAILAKAEDEARIKKEQAQRDIEVEKNRVQKEIRTEIVDVALEVAKKVVGREVEGKDTDRLVDEFLKKNSTNLFKITEYDGTYESPLVIELGTDCVSKAWFEGSCYSTSATSVDYFDEIGSCDCFTGSFITRWFSIAKDFHDRRKNAAAIIDCLDFANEMAQKARKNYGCDILQ